MVRGIFGAHTGNELGLLALGHSAGASYRSRPTYFHALSLRPACLYGSGASGLSPPSATPLALPSFSAIALARPGLLPSQNHK